MLLTAECKTPYS